MSRHATAVSHISHSQKPKATAKGRASDRGAQHSTAQHSTAQHSTAQHITQHERTQESTVVVARCMRLTIWTCPFAAACCSARCSLLALLAACSARCLLLATRGAVQTLATRRNSSAGRQREAMRRCVRTYGGGNLITRTDSPHPQAHHAPWPSTAQHSTAQSRAEQSRAEEEGRSARLD